MLNKFTIKRLVSREEINNAIYLAGDVFMEFEAPVYSDEGIKSFMEFISDGSIIHKVNNGVFFIWGCYKNDILAGMMALRDGRHVSLAFTKKDFHRQGVGRMLFAALREHSEAQGFREITVNSSPYGLPFYRALGFLATDCECVKDGIRYTPMIYRSSLKKLTY